MQVDLKRWENDGRWVVEIEQWSFSSANSRARIIGLGQPGDERRESVIPRTARSSEMARCFDARVFVSMRVYTMNRGGKTCACLPEGARGSNCWMPVFGISGAQQAEVFA
jgi:hypothetical protein